MTGSVAAVSPPAPAPRWPSVTGMIGVILAILTLVDKAGDLLFLLLWSDADWTRTLGSELARQVVPLIPPTPWIALTSLVWAGLAVLLLRGSLRLRSQRPSAIRLCRLWSWLAIVWFGIEMAIDLSWLSRISPRITAMAAGGWESYAVWGILLAVTLMLAFPVFLLVWLSRPAVQRDYVAWRHRASSSLDPGSD